MDPSVFDASICSDYASFGTRASSDADRDDTEPSIYPDVHVVEHVTAGGGVAKTLRETGGPSQLQHDLEADYELLSTPIAPGADPTTTMDKLQKMRQRMFDKAIDLASRQRRLDTRMRKYNTVHGFEPARGNTDKLN